MRHRYYDGMTQAQIGQEYGVCPQRARQIEQQALRKLRKPKITGPLRQFVEQSTPYYLHVGVKRFNSTGSSSTEQIAIIREDLTNRLCNQMPRA